MRVTARLLLVEGTEFTEVTVPLTSFVLALAPYLRWHSASDVTWWAFACTLAPITKRGSTCGILSSIRYDLKEVTVPLTSFVLAMAPYLRWHSDSDVTWWAFACTLAPITKRGSTCGILSSIRYDLKEVCPFKVQGRPSTKTIKIPSQKNQPPKIFNNSSKKDIEPKPFGPNLAACVTKRYAKPGAQRTFLQNWQSIMEVGIKALYKVIWH